MKHSVGIVEVVVASPLEDFPILLSLSRYQARHLYNMLGEYREECAPSRQETATIAAIDAVLERSL